MGLSTYLRANNYLFEGLDGNSYSKIAEALDLVVPLDIGVRHNATRNIEISIPIATWHKGFAIDRFLWELAGEPEPDEFELNLDRSDISDAIMKARDIANNPDSYEGFSDRESEDWVQIQFVRLERALTDYLLDDRLRGWTLKVWRSY